MTDESTPRYYIDELTVPETPDIGEQPKPWKKTTIIGTVQPRVDGYERVSGTAVYPSDLVLPDMLYGAILRCPYPRAEVKNIDLTPAKNMTGVRAVIAADDLDRDLKWTYSSSSKKIETALFDPQCRFEGEAVAAVAADTPYQARDAVRAIKVEFTEKAFIVDETKALKKGAPAVHPDGNQVQTQTYQRGDPAEGFKEADVVLEETYTTACEIHTPMELHGCVANWDGDRLTIWESSQGVYAVQKEVSRILGLPLSKVRVIGHYMGGGFGSKLQAGKYTIIAALLAKKTARPVKLVLTREETFLATGNRPPAHMTLKAGVKKDGTLVALDFRCTGTGGAYPAGGTSLVDWLIRDLYTCEHVKCTATDVYTNAGPARPFRAPGHPQGSWALEQMLDALANAIGIDPVALRLRNIPTVSQARKGNPPYTTTGLEACIQKGAEAFGWQKRRTEAAESQNGPVRRGVGMGSALWIVGDGGPPSTVIVKLFSDGSVNLNMGASDIGTGTKTVMAMVLAEELGLKPDVIQIEHADTGTTQYATPSGGSKTVPTEAPTVRAAALDVKRKLLDMAARDLGEKADRLEFEGHTIAVRGNPSKQIAVLDISGLNTAGVVVGLGQRGPNPKDKVINPFAAQFCEVEVDTRTGEVKILDFLGAHDSGRVMDRLTYDNQVFGGITMGIGFAMTEGRILDAQRTGKMVNRNWHDYKLPTALDVPAQMTSLPIERPDDEANTTGAKGLGEPVTIPTAAAIANAIHHATGVRVTETPMTPVHLMVSFKDLKKETTDAA